MGLLSWIILGLIAGVIADFLMGGRIGLIGSIIVGIVGAIVGRALHEGRFSLAEAVQAAKTQAPA